MPLYKTLTLPPALYPDNSYAVFSADSPTSGQASERVALMQAQDGTPQQVSVEINFSGAPGAFNLQIQTADTDTANAYQTETNGTITAVGGSGSGNYVRAELSVHAKFMRLLMSTQTGNSVTVTANINR